MIVDVSFIGRVRAREYVSKCVCVCVCVCVCECMAGGGWLVVGSDVVPSHFLYPSNNQEEEEEEQVH